MALVPQPDAFTPVLVTTYNDPRVANQGRAAARGAMLVYVNGDGDAVLMAKQGDGPNDWEPFIPPPPGDPNQVLLGNLKWSEPAGFSNGLMAVSQLQPIFGPALLGNASAGTGPVSALTPAQSLGVLGIQVVAKTADTPFTSTAYADVPVGASGSPTLGWDLVADQRYHFRFITLVRSSNQNIGPGLTVTTPTYTVFGAAAMLIGQAGAGPSVIFGAPITDSQGPAVASSVDLADHDYIFGLEGIIVPNAPGRLTLQARIETGSTATVTVRRGSFGILTAT